MRLSIEENPAFVATALEGVQLSRLEAVNIGVAHANDVSMNMLARPLKGQGIQLLGFFTPISLGVEGLPRSMNNLTTLDQLPEKLHDIDRVGKGVGARFYNTLSALQGWHDTQPVGLYGVKVGEVVDTRNPSDHTPLGWARRIGSHAAKQARISWLGQAIHPDNTLQNVVSETHRGYGNTDSVLISSPPRAILRQKYERHTRDAAIAPATFALIRKRLNLELVANVTT